MVDRDQVRERMHVASAGRPASSKRRGAPLDGVCPVVVGWRFGAVDARIGLCDKVVRLD